MKKLLLLVQGALFILMNISLLMAIYDISSSSGSMKRPGYNTPSYNNKEEFDPSLARLNKIDKLVSYCDSLYAEEAAVNASIKFENNFPNIVSSVVRKRFYHGYSLYGFSNNYMAMFFSKITKEGLSAIVIPDDILHFPYAACSQQSIIMMEVLKRKGFDTRKVSFQGKMGGHFCFEVLYNGSWHFYDPDMEPDMVVLNQYNRPGVRFLARHPDILLSAYRHYPREKVMDLFSSYYFGRVNSPAAPKAYFFQKITRFLSYSMWTFFLVLFIIVRKKYLRLRKQQYVRPRRVHFPQLQPGTTGSYHFEY